MGHDPSRRWTRRRFLKHVGGTAMVALALDIDRAAWREAAGGCAYGSGNYGAGPYSGNYPTALPSIRLDKAAADVVLTWEPGPDGMTYEVWRSFQPFRPGDPGATLVAVVAGTAAVDEGAMVAAEDRYYAVRGVPDCGAGMDTDP
jgi:hypothetical protein